MGYNRNLLYNSLPAIIAKYVRVYDWTDEFAIIGDKTNFCCICVFANFQNQDNHLMPRFNSGIR